MDTGVRVTACEDGEDRHSNLVGGGVLEVGYRVTGQHEHPHKTCERVENTLDPVHLGDAGRPLEANERRARSNEKKAQRQSFLGINGGGHSVADAVQILLAIYFN